MWSTFCGGSPGPGRSPPGCSCRRSPPASLRNMRPQCRANPPSKASSGLLGELSTLSSQLLQAVGVEQQLLAVALSGAGEREDGGLDVQHGAARHLVGHVVQVPGRQVLDGELDDLEDPLLEVFERRRDVRRDGGKLAAFVYQPLDGGGLGDVDFFCTTWLATAGLRTFLRTAVDLLLVGGRDRVDDLVVQVLHHLDGVVAGGDDEPALLGDGREGRVLFNLGKPLLQVRLVLGDDPPEDHAHFEEGLLVADGEHRLEPDVDGGEEFLGGAQHMHDDGVCQN
ncbi:M48 family peptidase [Babesia caballi]|uniref:M48 family peptidase n=1 Tax=Babesia caballi TaxID=5871 RepID=A0AAV4LUM6_BABCB|nr:M48 family peptidase [Babesia caballi]